MRNSTLYIWKDNNESPKTDVIAQNYTFWLYIFFLFSFVLYGVITTSFFDYLEEIIEAAINSKDISWLNSLFADSHELDDYVDIAMVLLSLVGSVVLHFLIKFIGYIISLISMILNKNEGVFKPSQLNQIVHHTMFLTTIFYIAYAIYNRTSENAYIAISFFVLFIGEYLSPGSFKNKQANNNSKNYKKEHKRGNKNQILVFCICLFSIPVTFRFDYLSNYNGRKFITYLLLMILLLIIFSYNFRADRWKINRLILQRKFNNRVLFYGAVNYNALLQNLVFISVRLNYIHSKRISRGYKCKKFDTIILINPLDSESKKSFLKNEIESLLAPSGVIVAPAYTSNKKGSKLLSPDEYKSVLEKMGFKIRYDCNTNTITYVELIKPIS